MEGTRGGLFCCTIGIGDDGLVEIDVAFCLAKRQTKRDGSKSKKKGRGRLEELTMEGIWVWLGGESRDEGCCEVGLLCEL